MTSSTPARPEDPFVAFQREFPEAFRKLLATGYEPAGEGVMGRCHDTATLFVECQRDGAVRGWVWDVQTEQFVGSTFVVRGRADLALARVRELIESTYAQDRLSGTAPRHAKQVVDETHSA